MERMELKAVKRPIGKGPSKKLRREGCVPAVLYGPGRDPVAFSVNLRELDKAVATKAGWNILLDLDIEGKRVLSRILDYQADVLKRNITHVDFQVLDLKKKIRTEVPLNFIGKPEGVKKGGILEVIRRTLEVRCFPTNIPERIDVDVSGLDIGQNIHVEELKMSEGVEGMFETNFSIATISAPTEELTAPEAAAVPVEEGAAAPAPGTAPAAPGAAAPAKPEEAKGKAAEKGEGKK